MTSNKTRFVRIALAAALLAAGSATAADVDGNRVLNADKELEKGNWMTYHGGYKSWHYSALDQINTSNVDKLTEAWSHVASRANRGLQGFPLAIDGVLYYSSPYNQVYALDGATGQVLWTYKQKLNEDLVATPDALAVQPRHRRRLRQHLHGHARRQAGRHRHEDRQAQLGNQAGRLREADGRLHRRAPAGQGQSHHRLARR